MSQAPLCVLKVALALPLPRCFDYLLPNELIGEDLPGRRVRVPFGKDEKIGVIDSLEIMDASQYATSLTELKNIVEVLDAEPIFSRELFSSLRWLSRYTQAPIGEVFATALPVLLRQGQALPDNKVMAWELTSLGRHQYSFLRANTQLRKFAERLLKQPVSEDQLDIEKDHWRNSANTLKRRGLVERIALPPSKVAVKTHAGPVHNVEQKQVLHAIEKHGAGKPAPGFHCHLLEGVTGSGKTEIYLQAIEHVCSVANRL
jgi:primosomal protein N' (replication factor Y) (superfamily II helicase)